MVTIHDRYGDVEVRRIIPIALGLISISNPQVNVMDTLSKLSHDNDHEISLNAILSLGLIGAGTNNSRIAGLLRQLSSYYQREPNHLFLVKISQVSYMFLFVSSNEFKSLIIDPIVFFYLCLSFVLTFSLSHWIFILGFDCNGKRNNDLESISFGSNASFPCCPRWIIGTRSCYIGYQRKYVIGFQSRI